MASGLGEPAVFVSLTKLEIAEAQLYQSISLYMEGKDLVSAVTLAGASDEILGKMNQAVGRSAALHDKLDLLCNLSEAAFKKKATRKNFAEIRNKARNALVCLDMRSLSATLRGCALRKPSSIANGSIR